MSLCFYNENYLTLAQRLVNISAVQAYNEGTQLEILNAMKMMSYLRNNKVDIIEFLYNQMRITWRAKSLKPKRVVWRNEIPRIINRLSLTYKPMAERIIDSDKYGVDTNGSTIEPESQKNYNKTHKNIQKAMKDVSAQAKLMNTVLVRPIFDADKEQFTYQVLTRADSDVEYSDMDKDDLTLVRYYKNWRNPANDYIEEIIVVYWTETEHYAMTLGGARLKPYQWKDEEATDENPYKVIPFLVLRMTETTEFWGDGLAQLVDAQEEINVRLTDLHFKVDLSFGVATGTNLGIKKDSYGLAPDEPIFVDDVKNDDQAPSFKFDTPEHKITEQLNLIELEQSNLSVSQGLPSADLVYSSGYDRELANLELLEINENDQEIYRDFEEKLFELEKVILKAESNLNIGETFNIEFGKIEFPKTEDEQIKEREFELKYNISTPVDWIKEERGIDSDEEAIKMLEENKRMNQKFIGQGTNIQDLLTPNQEVI